MNINELIEKLNKLSPELKKLELHILCRSYPLKDFKVGYVDNMVFLYD